MSNTSEPFAKPQEKSPSEPKGKRSSGKPRGERARASAVVLKKLTRLPMGELSRFASELVESDRECADFLRGKLDAALEGHAAKRGD